MLLDIEHNLHNNTAHKNAFHQRSTFLHPITIQVEVVVLTQRIRNKKEKLVTRTRNVGHSVVGRKEDRHRLKLIKHMLVVIMNQLLRKIDYIKDERINN